MSGILAAIEILALLVASAAAIVSVIGIAAGRDVYVQLIFGSIASGGAVVALVIAAVAAQGLSIVTLQCVVLVLLMVPSSAIATQRIAALVRDRTAAPTREGDERT